MARTVDPDKHAARRAAIVDAAAWVFAEKGYDAATTADVHKAAGVGSGTLFHYFPDKATLFRAVFEADRPRLEAAVDAIRPLPPEEGLLRLLDVLVQDVTDPRAPGLLIALLGRAVQDPVFAASLEETDAIAKRCLADLLRAGQAQGVVRDDLDPERAARWVHAQVDALYLMCGEGGFDADAEKAELRVLVDRYLGLAPDGPTT